MKRILILISILLVTSFLVGCGGSEGAYTNRTLKAGDFFKYETFRLDATTTIDTFYYNNTGVDGRFIDRYTTGGSYLYSAVWFERNIENNANDGSRWMIEQYNNNNDNYVVCIVPSNNLEIGDRWFYDGREVELTKTTIFTDNYNKRYTVYIIEGVNSNLYYEYSPTMGFLTYYDGEKLTTFDTRAAVKSSIKEIKSNNKLKLKK